MIVDINASSGAISGRAAFSMLSPGMQRWVAKQGWADLRPIQTMAIGALLGNDKRGGLLVSAPTSGGKTESAFLPALSMVERHYITHKDDRSVCMLYVAPLKALINDQYRRLSDMASGLNVPVYLWHGDAPQGQKKQMLREHDGIIMITPESLESFLMNRGAWCARYMHPIVTVVDEFHAFLGEGRGKQLLSLLDRIDAICDMTDHDKAVRIGLSATLSKLDIVGKILCPRCECSVIDGSSSGSDVLDMFVRLLPPSPKIGDAKRGKRTDDIAVAKEIISGSINEKTLTFAGSRMQVEEIAATINDVCRHDNINSEAFPHHGSLSRETREALEKRLVGTDKPTMAIATVTLELGIDIGDIYRVFQVGTANSVASLRQRIGRSGRRDGHKRAECIVTEAAAPQDMEKDLVTTIAEIELMKAGWFEPPKSNRRDVSVLVSEILSVLKQYGNAYDDDLYALLVERGAFTNVPRDMFGMIIADMLEKEFLFSDTSRLLMIGDVGENEINDWKFYATFASEEAYTVKSGSKTIGEITPPSTSLQKLAQGGTFMLGGRYWQVVRFDGSAKSIEVKQTSARSQFLVPTSRGCAQVGGMIKRTRIQLLTGKNVSYVPDYIDDNAREKLAEAREYASSHHLNGLGVSIWDGGEAGHETESESFERVAHGYNEQALVTIDPPVDPATLDAIVKVLEAAGMEDGGMSNMPLWRAVELVESVLWHWDAIVDNREQLLDSAMLADIRSSEKYNYVFSDETLRYAYIDEKIDLVGAKRWFDAFMRFAGTVGCA